MAQKRFQFVHPVNEHDRVGMSEWRRLEGCTSRQTLWRWTSTGVKSRSGKIVKLPTFSHGGRRYTTFAAYVWWCEEQQR